MKKLFTLLVLFALFSSTASAFGTDVSTVDQDMLSVMGPQDLPIITTQVEVFKVNDFSNEITINESWQTNISYKHLTQSGEATEVATNKPRGAKNTKQYRRTDYDIICSLGKLVDISNNQENRIQASSSGGAPSKQTEV